MERALCAPFLGAMLAVLTVVGSAARAAVLEQHLLPAADTFVRGGNASNKASNFGGLAAIELRHSYSTDTSFQRKGYLRFDLGQLDHPIEPGATHTLSLTLSANWNNANSVIHRVHALNAGYSAAIGQLGTDWDEMAINWNNAPANLDTPGGLVAGATTLLGSFSVGNNAPAGTNYTISLANIENYLNYVDGRPYLTLIIVRDLNTQFDVNVTVASKEHSNADYRPKLTVMTVIPEPATLGMMLLPALFAMRRGAWRAPSL